MKAAKEGTVKIVVAFTNPGNVIANFLKHDAILLKAGDEWEANRVEKVEPGGAPDTTLLTLARPLKSACRGENQESAQGICMQIVLCTL